MNDFIVNAARTLYRVFEEQNAPEVYGTVCCGRLYVGTQPARKCRTCQGVPKCIRISAEADLDNLA